MRIVHTYSINGMLLLLTAEVPKPLVREKGQKIFVNTFSIASQRAPGPTWTTLAVNWSHSLRMDRLTDLSVS